MLTVPPPELVPPDDVDVPVDEPVLVPPPLEPVAVPPPVLPPELEPEPHAAIAIAAIATSSNAASGRTYLFTDPPPERSWFPDEGG
jgi:hypothetical protein